MRFRAYLGLQLQVDQIPLWHTKGSSGARNNGGRTFGASNDVGESVGWCQLSMCLSCE